MSPRDQRVAVFSIASVALMAAVVGLGPGRCDLPTEVDCQAACAGFASEGGSPDTLCEQACEEAESTAERDVACEEAHDRCVGTTWHADAEAALSTACHCASLDCQREVGIPRAEDEACTP